MTALLKLSRLIDGFSRTLGKGLIWLILIATVISAANAIARKAFNIGSNSLLEIQWYLYAAVFLLGAGNTFLQNGHVRIDVLANKLGRKARMYIDILGILVFLLPLCYFMISFAWPMVERAYLSGEVSTNAGGLIRWPVYVLIPAGFSLLALQALSELIKRFGYLAGHIAYPLAQDEATTDDSDLLDTPAPSTAHDAAGEVRK